MPGARWLAPALLAAACGSESLSRWSWSASAAAESAEVQGSDSLSLLQRQTRLLDRGLEEPTGPGLRGRGPRVIFVAGVEGSGHHLLTLLWQELQWWGESLSWLKVRELHLPSTWDCQSDWSRGDVAAMTEEFQAINRSTDTVWILPIGYMSYPCGNGTHEERRDRFYPHVDWIAEAARAGGVDLSVLFLHRPVEDVLASACLHRQFGTCDDSTEVIAANGLRLAEQIRTVQAFDRGCTEQCVQSVQCLEFGDKHAVTRGVLGALGFTREQLRLNKAIHKLWEPCSTDKSTCGTSNFLVTCCGEDNRESVPGWAELVARLQPTETALLDACKQAVVLHSGSELLSGPIAQE